METSKELMSRITILKAGLSKLSGKVKASVETQIADLETQHATALASEGQGASSNIPQGASNGVTFDTFLSTLLSSFGMTMKSGAGSGVDTPEVRKIIENYLQKDNVKLNELNKETLEYINANKTIDLKIPNFSQPLEIDSSVAKISNFFEIIDDVLAGGNVFLIGEAGGGKTFTAEQVCKALKYEYITLNCSQYTSPLEILGGQSVDGFKNGKLIDCWKNGKILILDEMPKLDPNTAGLFNDALAKSSKTNINPRINSADTDEAPIPRNDKFGIIATGNIYPNEPPPPQYRGNSQQDLSLLDRFSGGVYYTEFSPFADQNTTRFKFLYEFLIGNYYKYIDAKEKGLTGSALPTPTGLRTIIEHLGFKNLALVSMRTNIAFRVSFEYELVRAIAEKDGKGIQNVGKTLAKTFKSYMVAFKSAPDTYRSLITKTGYTDDYINNLVKKVIKDILADKSGGAWLNSLNEEPRKSASVDKIYDRYEKFYVAETTLVVPAVTTT